MGIWQFATETEKTGWNGTRKGKDQEKSFGKTNEVLKCFCLMVFVIIFYVLNVN